jgi:hypothetical protein
MAAFGTLVATARTKTDEVETLRRDSETATEDRDGLLGHKKDQTSTTPGTVLNFVSRARDILQGNFRGNEQHLGDFGFTVNHSSASSDGGNGDGDPPTATGTVGGVVKGKVSLLPISGALAEIAGTSVMGTTDATGIFILDKIPVGEQTLRVSAAGYQTIEVAVTVTENVTANVNVELDAVPVP